MPDRAETLRAALRRQHLARDAYERARRQRVEGETDADRSLRLTELGAAADAADADMARLRAEPEAPPPAWQPDVHRPVPPGESN